MLQDPRGPKGPRNVGHTNEWGVGLRVEWVVVRGVVGTAKKQYQ